MANHSHRDLILASGSPRRAALLEQLGFRLQVLVPRVPEEHEAGESPAAYTRRLASDKADAAATLTTTPCPDWVLAADTVVVCDDDILEKPSDPDDAAAMLQRLSDRWHEVVTSLCVHHRLDRDRRAVRTITTEVRFRAIDAATIERYVATGEPMDKAGAYGIQDLGGAFCREIRGSYSSVVGLPVCEVIEVLEELGAVTHFPFLDER